MTAWGWNVSPSPLPIVSVFVTDPAFAGGADPTGVADSTAAFQAAINSFTAGGNVLVPDGTYKVTSTLNVGDGSGSQGSTKRGVILAGVANANTVLIGAFTASAGAKIVWAGPINTPVIQVNGPLQGWGIQNLVIDCGSIAGSIGIKVISAQYGYSYNITVLNCVVGGILSTTVAPFGSYTNTDSLHNSYANIQVNFPTTVASGAYGIKLTGVSSSNTDFNTLYNVTVFVQGPTSSIIYGAWLQNCDSNLIHGLQITGAGGAGNLNTLNLDYSASSGNVWPASNVIIGIEGGTAPIINTGTPGSGARPNYLYGLIETNGLKNPNLTNLNPSLPTVVAPGLDLTGQTGSLGATNLMQISPYVVGMYRINLYLEITTIGAAGTVFATVFWGDDSGATQSAVSSTINMNQNTVSSQLTMPIRLAQGAIPTLTTTVAGASGSPKYDIHVRLEKLD